MSAADRLFASLSRAWGRAVTLSASEDLPREYVNVLLPLMPEMADDLLRAHEGSMFNEHFLMLDHAPLLGRYARDRFLERVIVVPVPPRRATGASRKTHGATPRPSPSSRATTPRSARPCASSSAPSSSAWSATPCSVTA